MNKRLNIDELQAFANRASGTGYAAVVLVYQWPTLSEPEEAGIQNRLPRGRKVWKNFPQVR